MRVIQAAAAATALLATTTYGAAAAGAQPQQTDRALSIRVFAAGTSQQFGPDDLVHLGHDVFVAWQNGVGSTGGASDTGNSQSTLVEYAPSGAVLHSWSLTGKIDGMGADPKNERVIATVNEDGASSLYTVTPAAAPGDQVVHYQYSPSGTLPHGGGTDSVTVMGGHIFISASAPTVADGPALYQAVLSSGTATLEPVFFDNSTATVANTDAADFGRQVALALTDPDSNTRVPEASPRFGGDLLLDSQGDGEQIYVSHPGSDHPTLSLLRLDQSVDDTAFATDQSGTLYITDSANNEVFAVTGDFQRGTAYTSVTPADANTPGTGPNYLAQLNLWTGQTTPVTTVPAVQAKGMIFVPSQNGEGQNGEGGNGEGQNGQGQNSQGQTRTASSTSDARRR